jgi:hypothetical protein
VAQPNGTVDVFLEAPGNGLGHAFYVPGRAWGSETLTSGVG